MKSSWAGSAGLTASNSLAARSLFTTMSAGMGSVCNIGLLLPSNFCWIVRKLLTHKLRLKPLHLLMVVPDWHEATLSLVLGAAINLGGYDRFSCSSIALCLPLVPWQFSLVLVAS
ncbi:unnamed protein product [Polarella glacialis]|uniref:Uncharacterized protein n=1 Tax=Polarella glacialis TaxID=89957 RepID=A0A813K053_POLGL|nr:unnamed protein product [Polarella glacialis]